jgi:hypothetical protein
MSSRPRLFAALVRYIVIVGILGATARPAAASARSADYNEQTDGQTLETALALAGPHVAKLPIALTSLKPDNASAGAQAWTTVDLDGTANRIFVFTGSPAFRCAKQSKDNSQCRVKLASVIVHEAWHFKHGSNEAEAYSAQLLFMLSHDAALEQIVDVRRSRDWAIAAQRKAIEAAKQLARDSSR